ncbi:hypothetical protein [Pseudomonas palleroniana]|uniref:hypothetical protein n=1 Tax=Pseudomonas palleroniana TaxID=191390 RepID=UPI0018E671C5|nr:hypothetical protein [Pseudomonas palleroniana]MBI6908296.1 hypothetical protein [Pseudomonas palleroniana]
MNRLLLLAATLGLVLLGVWQPAWVGGGALAAAVNGSNIALGCLLLALLTPLISGRWQTLLTPGSRLGASAVWLIIPMLLPVLITMPWVYPWFNQQAPGFRGLWLSPWFFVLRTLVYGAIFWLLRGWPGKRNAAGLILYAPVASLAAVDWLMSLQAGFVSSVFGLLSIARQLLDGVAFAGLCGLCWNVMLLPARQCVLLRGLLVSALAFWLYVQFMQYLIIWSVDLPHEITWYSVRETGGWGALTALLFAGQLACLGVLASPWGERMRVLTGGCAAILLLSVVESMWISLPSIFPQASLGAFLTAVLCQAVYAAGLFALWRRQWQRRRHDC